jgi:hypothetical protein
MKKLVTFVFAILLGATLTFAQDTGGSKDQKTTKTEDTTKAHKGGKKAHKGGKKSKKGAGDTGTTPPPK